MTDSQKIDLLVTAVTGMQHQITGIQHQMTGMQQQIDSLQDEMRTEFANVRSEMRTEFANVRSEMRAMHDKLDSKIDSVKHELDSKIDSVKHELQEEIFLNRQAIFELNEHVRERDTHKGLDIEQLKQAHEDFRRRFAHLYKQQRPPFTE
ncbi:DUF1640 domain-containing protein [Tumebacillus sp. ITR2]|uniref:DUF1640 domain-containing protein n=1 Tax=Tumebacillus amylolyticus TaxID=2801339 RepID=A0ABS1J8W7_9BACL|nr:coiled-coil domain-containing protein [Tumebacillus amylolyticus]MBL0386721.1 DUF1640 domain-containing protein [Tumebacillus amylolyticus]